MRHKTIYKRIEWWMIWDEKEIDILVEIGTISGIMDMQTSFTSFEESRKRDIYHNAHDRVKRCCNS
jgi:hypothetical protein